MATLIAVTNTNETPVYDNVTHLNALEVLNNLYVDGNLIVTGSTVSTEAATAVNTVGAATLTAAKILTKNIIRGGAQAGAAFTDTTDTAALIVAAIPNAAIGQSFKFTYVNNTNAVATLAGGTGVNSAGTIAQLAPGTQINVIVVLTSLTALTFTVLVDGGARDFLPESITTLSTVGAGTITGAGIASGITSRSGSQSATPFSDATDTAANIIAAIPQAFIGETWDYWYVNTTNAQATLTNGTGVTVSGITVIPAGYAVKYLATYTAAATVTLVATAVGTAAISDQSLIMAGSTSGTTTLVATATAGSTTLTFPAVTGTLASTSGANLLVTDTYRCTGSVTANNTAVPATVTGLSGSVAIGTYRFRAVLPSTVASGTGGIAYNFLLTTAVLSSIQYGATMKTSAALQYTQGTTATSGTVIATQAAVVLETTIEGTFVVSTAGTFALQMAQAVANASNSITLVGSSMTLERIA